MVLKISHLLPLATGGDFTQPTEITFCPRPEYRIYLWTALEVDALAEAALVEGVVQQRSVSVPDPLCVHHIQRL